jgi:autotransporter-associated beta strand protein
MNYAGPTIITNNGVLNLAGGGDRLNTATNVVVASGVLNLGGNNQTVAGLMGEGTVNKAGGTLTVNVFEGSDAFAGVLAGAGNLVKTGSGTLVLSGTNTHSGNTLVSAGSLELASIGSLRFAIGGSGTNTALLGSGAASLDGQFVLDLSAASTSTSATWTIVANTLTADYGPHFIVAGFSGAGGNWTNTTNGVKYIFSQSTGVLSVQSAAINNYANWLTNYPSLTGVDALRGADPDSDGFDNGMEFAFDGNPTIGSPAFLTGVNVGSNVAFNYIARKNPPGGVTYQLQHTTNLSLGPWTNSFVTVSNSANQAGINIPADYERKEFVVPGTNNNFFRVRATIAP